MCKGGRFARRPTTEYSRSPVLSFFKKSWAHFLCPETFLRCWHFCSVLRGREQPRGNFCKSTKTHLAKCFISWKEIILKFFCQRLNFTPPKFQIGERFFQTVDFSLVNVLTSREKNFSKNFLHYRWFLPSEIPNKWKHLIPGKCSSSKFNISEPCILPKKCPL